MAKSNNNGQNELVAIVSFNLADDSDSDLDLSYSNNSNEDFRNQFDDSIPTSEESTEVFTSDQDDAVNDPTIISNNEGSDTHPTIDDEEESVESLENTMVTNAHVDFDLGSDDDSVESSTEDYGIKQKEYKDVFDENEGMTVVCVMIVDDNSFNSLPSSPSTRSTISFTILNLL